MEIHKIDLTKMRLSQVLTNVTNDFDCISRPLNSLKDPDLKSPKVSLNKVVPKVDEDITSTKPNPEEIHLQHLQERSELFEPPGMAAPVSPGGSPEDLSGHPQQHCQMHKPEGAENPTIVSLSQAVTKEDEAITPSKQNPDESSKNQQNQALLRKRSSILE